MGWYKRKKPEEIPNEILKERPEKLKNKKPKYDYIKDRFSIYVHKDNNQFLVKVFDRWSDILYSEEKAKKGFLDCRTVTFVLNEKESEKEEKYVSEVVDNAKEHLRKLFTEKRSKNTKKYDKKKKQKIREVQNLNEHQRSDRVCEK